MNHMEKVAQMLGVELDEEFMVKGVCYKFTEKCLMGLNPASGWYLAPQTLYNILNGTFKLVKLPKPILDKKEKEYLSYVIRPFRNRIKYICKNNNEDGDTEFLDVQLDDNDFMAFPNFKKGTMYKGMEANRKYSLEELGL